MTTYSLPNVKPHVVAAANEIGTRFNIKTIGGWRARDPYPDHPAGLALDFMIDNLSQNADYNRSVGDAIAAYVIANATRLSVKYMIWNRNTWNSTRRTWVVYEHNDVNPHTDHVHVTFNPVAGSGGSIVDVLSPTGMGLPNPLEDIQSWIAQWNQATKIFEWLSDSHNWLRILYVAIGAALIFGILTVMFFQSDAPRMVGEIVGG